MSPVVPNFAYVTGNPDHLVGGQPAVMTDIQGPFYDLRAYVNGQLVNTLNTLSPPAQALISASVGDVGMLNQVRAGRQLALADFTMLGLPAPLGLWNLGDLSDVSGNGRSLSNKGGVGFASGINGVAGTSAQFTGSTVQALYIADTGAADPFRIRTGSWGCWFRTAKRGTDQTVIAKYGTTTNQRAYRLLVNSVTNTMLAAASPDGTSGTLVTVTGVSDVADDRWHFAVVTHDATALRLYVDGVLEASSTAAFPIFAGSGALGIGGVDVETVTVVSAHYGRVDEAFVTDTVLTDDQIRALYLAKIPHGYATTPTRLALSVRRRRRGAAFVSADFPSQPVRLYNFTGVGNTGNDEGSNGVALTVGGAGNLAAVAGADGSKDGSISMSGGVNLQGTDAGLPSGLAARSYGCWFKTTGGPGAGIAGWGTLSTADARFGHNTNGLLSTNSAADAILGPYVADGQWHYAVIVEDNAAGDGVRRKLYCDGRLVGGSTVLNSVTLAGANRFRIGALPDGTGPFTGQIDGAFVTAGALTFEQVAALYSKGTQGMPPSPKNEGDHVEFCDSTAVYATFDSLASCDQVDVGVSA